jgi:DNA-binding transcriptional MerR regulator
VKIGELAKRTGFAESQIRYYERRGLLPRPTRGEAGYRLYGEADVARLGLLRRAKLHGLPLSEAGELLELAENGCCEQTEPTARVAVERRIAEIDAQVAELQALRATLAGSLASWPPEAAEGCGGAFCLPNGSAEAAVRQVKVPERRLPVLGDGCCEPDCGPETCGS